LKRAPLTQQQIIIQNHFNPITHSSDSKSWNDGSIVFKLRSNEIVSNNLMPLVILMRSVLMILAEGVFVEAFIKQGITTGGIIL